MKLRMLSAVRRLVVALSIMSSSVGVADVASNASTARVDNSSSPLTDFLTLESILLVGVVLLALVVIARKRKVP
jgi:hypothetical protein